jgi:hypothetical protein
MLLVKDGKKHKNKMNNKIRNAFHILIGFTIGYIFFIKTKINAYPINLEHWNNFFLPIVGFVVGAIAGIIWERIQEKIFGANFDLNDVLRTGFGGLAGGVVSLFFVSKILMLILLSISLILVFIDLIRFIQIKKIISKFIKIKKYGKFFQSK